MKILIQNYASPISSEPLYFNQTFSMTEGLESLLWSPSSIGVFDVFDKFQPDAFVCHHMGVTNEILTYLASNTKIKVAVNITNISKENLDLLEKLISENNINCEFMFSNNYDFIDQCKPQSNVYKKILPCADIYFSPSQVPDYNLEAAIIANTYNEKIKDLESNYKSYHKMKIGTEQADDFDMNVNIIMLSSLYEKYEEIVICDTLDIAFSQIFFDAFLKAKKVSVKLPDDQEHLFTKALAEIFEDEEEDDMLNKIKNQIKTNHTSVNRSRQLIEGLV
tara:strand:- start:14711 stop:15544 length:834 start_codon:yes stop_codon:yes gene_type:complete